MLSLIVLFINLPFVYADIIMIVSPLFSPIFIIAAILIELATAYFILKGKLKNTKKYFYQPLNPIKINFLTLSYVRNENCTIYGAVVSFTVFISEHPKNKGLYKPHLLRCGALCFFDIDIWGTIQIPTSICQPYGLFFDIYLCLLHNSR